MYANMPHCHLTRIKTRWRNSKGGLHGKDWLPLVLMAFWVNNVDVDGMLKAETGV